jgi:hypothetical protein
VQQRQQRARVAVAACEPFGMRGGVAPAPLECDTRGGSGYAVPDAVVTVVVAGVCVAVVAAACGRLVCVPAVA